MTFITGPRHTSGVNTVYKTMSHHRIMIGICGYTIIPGLCILEMKLVNPGTMFTKTSIIMSMQDMLIYYVHQ